MKLESLAQAEGNSLHGMRPDIQTIQKGMYRYPKREERADEFKGRLSVAVREVDKKGMVGSRGQKKREKEKLLLDTKRWKT